ncbi:hypothetical protein BB559_006558, partial [Furculomyces boomerangus]
MYQSYNTNNPKDTFSNTSSYSGFSGTGEIDLKVDDFESLTSNNKEFENLYTNKTKNEPNYLNLNALPRNKNEGMSNDNTNKLSNFLAGLLKNTNKPTEMPKKPISESGIYITNQNQPKESLGFNVHNHYHSEGSERSINGISFDKVALFKSNKTTIIYDDTTNRTDKKANNVKNSKNSPRYTSQQEISLDKPFSPDNPKLGSTSLRSPGLSPQNIIPDTTFNYNDNVDSSFNYPSFDVSKNNTDTVNGSNTNNIFDSTKKAEFNGFANNNLNYDPFDDARAPAPPVQQPFIDPNQSNFTDIKYSNSNDFSDATASFNYSPNKPLYTQSESVSKRLNQLKKDKTNLMLETISKINSLPKNFNLANNLSNEAANNQNRNILSNSSAPMLTQMNNDSKQKDDRVEISEFQRLTRVKNPSTSNSPLNLSNQNTNKNANNINSEIKSKNSLSETENRVEINSNDIKKLDGTFSNTNSNISVTQASKTNNTNLGLESNNLNNGNDGFKPYLQNKPFFINNGDDLNEMFMNEIYPPPSSLFENLTSLEQSNAFEMYNSQKKALESGHEIIGPGSTSLKPNTNLNIPFNGYPESPNLSRIPENHFNTNLQEFPKADQVSNPKDISNFTTTINTGFFDKNLDEPQTQNQGAYLSNHLKDIDSERHSDINEVPQITADDIHVIETSFIENQNYSGGNNNTNIFAPDDLDKLNFSDAEENNHNTKETHPSNNVLQRLKTPGSFKKQVRLDSTPKFIPSNKYYKYKSADENASNSSGSILKIDEDELSFDDDYGQDNQNSKSQYEPKNTKNDMNPQSNTPDFITKKILNDPTQNTPWPCKNRLSNVPNSKSTNKSLNSIGIGSVFNSSIGNTPHSTGTEEILYGMKNSENHYNNDAYANMQTPAVFKKGYLYKFKDLEPLLNLPSNYPTIDSTKIPTYYDVESNTKKRIPTAMNLFQNQKIDAAVGTTPENLRLPNKNASSENLNKSNTNDKPSNNPIIQNEKVENIKGTKAAEREYKQKHQHGRPNDTSFEASNSNKKDLMTHFDSNSSFNRFNNTPTYIPIRKPGNLESDSNLKEHIKTPENEKYQRNYSPAPQNKNNINVEPTKPFVYREKPTNDSDNRDESNIKASNESGRIRNNKIALNGTNSDKNSREFSNDTKIIQNVTNTNMGSSGNLDNTKENIKPEGIKKLSTKQSFGENEKVFRNDVLTKEQLEELMLLLQKRIESSLGSALELERNALNAEMVAMKQEAKKTNGIFLMVKAELEHLNTKRDIEINSNNSISTSKKKTESVTSNNPSQRINVDTKTGIVNASSHNSVQHPASSNNMDNSENNTNKNIDLETHESLNSLSGINNNSTLVAGQVESVLESYRSELKRLINLQMKQDRRNRIHSKTVTPSMAFETQQGSLLPNSFAADLLYNIKNNNELAGYNQSEMKYERQSNNSQNLDIGINLNKFTMCTSESEQESNRSSVYGNMKTKGNRESTVEIKNPSKPKTSVQGVNSIQ